MTDLTISTHRLAVPGLELSYREYRPDPANTVDTPITGAGDPVVLLHGIAGSTHTWTAVLEELADRGFPGPVLAPDLPGHGDSSAPRADYSLGALACAVRDLLALLGHQRVTLVGHSLGGGVAMQFAYQFPDMCGRLVLVDSGGLGPEVSAVLRAAALPGAPLVLPLLANPVTVTVGARLGRLAERLGVRFSAEQRELARHFASLADPDRRQAFLWTARGVLDPHGQRVSAVDRLHLSAGVPTLIVWGDRDPLIPLAHGRRAAELIPDSRCEVFRDAGHFPHCFQPGRFADLLIQFVTDTKPAEIDIAELASRLVS
ncbi:MAG TPA: alpha/beta hydrolase [Pseudonocardiaceae bacterium]|nr:alpha/beta hydrolase [Pseudonocardiaceae bacterium]